MDVGKLLNNISSLNEYIAITQDSAEKCRNSRIQLNMSTILALKKIRSFEVEYVNKCEENGIASVIFGRMLHLPPSKTWGVLSKEVVSLLQYWLDAVRKHLVKHSPHWWTFLKSLLIYLKEVRQKDSSLPNILVEHTAECLFDLATTSGPDAMQRYEILHCFNMYCSESSRELRFALRTKFGHYFTKLATYMGDCGNLATQYSIMETLLRWLLPRQDRTLRMTSASKWFPARLYSDNVVDIFLERPWMNFFQDARDLLNAHNERSDLITSVICRKLTVGDIIIIRDTDKTDSWIDLNSATKCISVLLDPRVLDAFGCTNHKSFETFVVGEDNTHVAKLYRESEILILSVETLSPPRVLPSCIKLGEDVSCHVSAVVSSRSDVRRLDGALRRIFDTKYQLLLDLEKELILSPPKVIEQLTKKPEQDARFSNPVEVRRRKHSGYIVKSRPPLSCASPSTASTSSLAQLHEKLAELPRYKFDKEPLGVCAPPDLSIVTEVSEADDRNTTILNCKPYGVCQKKNNTLNSSRQTQSDTENNRRYPESKSKPKNRLLSPVVREETPSCLLVATIGSADDSVINDTVERLSKSKDYDPDNIVNLLVQEALNAKLEKDKEQIDSGINTREKTSEDLKEIGEVIDNTPNNDINLSKTVKHCPKVVFSSDESNTEAISDTPRMYVSTRRKKKDIPKGDSLEKKSFDVQVVENFFSQHFTENRELEVNSPTLAKKINETSSELSDDHLNDGLMLMRDDIQNLDSFNFNNIEVIECLNNIVDKVCEEFNKCSNYLSVDQVTAADEISDLEDDLPLKDILYKIQKIDSKNKEPVTPKTIKLKYKVTSKKDKIKTRSIKQKNKLDTPKMSTIIEDNADAVGESIVLAVTEENTENTNKISVLDNTADAETPLLRRKRKLFSPKDVKMAEAPENSQENDFVDSNIKKTPKSAPSYKPYKDIERERQRYIRLPRNRKSRKIETPSPRSKKMNDLFDKVQKSANSEKVKLVDKASDEYNFSSDSEDAFKAKRLEKSKRNSTNTAGSEESTVLRRGRVFKKINNSGKDEGKKDKRKGNRRQRTKKVTEVDLVNDLIDERMRDKKDVLDTSIVVNTPKILTTEPILVLDRAPEMEIITEMDVKSKKNQRAKVTKKNKVKTVDLTKAAKKTISIKPNTDNDRTESPLPGLVVEEALTTNKEDGEVSANMVDRFKKICQNPEQYINESNTTQNLLSDNDKVIYSPQTINITDEIVRLEIETTELGPKGKKPKNKKPSSVKKTKEKGTPKPKKSTTKISNDSASGSKSEQSIATVGITGHGDSEEAPPSPKSIMKQLHHRNLESEYLDNSTKDYFEKLTEEINILCHNDSNENDKRNVSNKSVKQNKVDTNTKSSGSRTSLRSPVVSIERISLEDISRWLPSRRNTESDNTSPISNKSKNNKDIESPKRVETEQVTDSENDPEILEAIKRSLRLIQEKSPVYKDDTNRERNESFISNNNSSDSVKNTKSRVLAKKIEKKTRVQYMRQVKCTPKSNISPIKCYESCIKNSDKRSQATLSDDEDYMNEIKRTISKNSGRTQVQSQSSIDEGESIKDVPQTSKSKVQLLKKSIPQQNLTQSTDSESIQDKMSTSTKIVDSRMLKRKLEDDVDDRKKKKLEDNNNIGDCLSGSGITGSSVDNWFKRHEPSGSQAQALHISARESIQNVVEKLDTTLIEIHQNTSKKFVHLFVAAQQQLCELKQERHGMYKRVAAGLLADMVRLMDDKFSDLDKWSQEQDMSFMKHLKEQASAVIREDCKQKRIMVQLLKEDVQSVLEHTKRNTD